MAKQIINDSEVQEVKDILMSTSVNIDAFFDDIYIMKAEECFTKAEIETLEKLGRRVYNFCANVSKKIDGTKRRKN